MDGRNGGKVGDGWMKRDKWVSLDRERWIEKHGWWEVDGDEGFRCSGFKSSQAFAMNW